MTTISSESQVSIEKKIVSKRYNRFPEYKIYSRCKKLLLKLFTYIEKKPNVATQWILSILKLLHVELHFRKLALTKIETSDLRLVYISEETLRSIHQKAINLKLDFYKKLCTAYRSQAQNRGKIIYRVIINALKGDKPIYKRFDGIIRISDIITIYNELYQNYIKKIFPQPKKTYRTVSSEVSYSQIVKQNQ